jgi:hypothetical protein
MVNPSITREVGTKILTNLDVQVKFSLRFGKRLYSGINENRLLIYVRSRCSIVVDAHASLLEH